MIFIFREPKACFASWKRDYYTKNKISALLDLGNFISTYSEFLKIRDQQTLPTYTVRYEDVAHDPVACSNTAFKGDMTVYGSFELGEMWPDPKGDDRAKVCTTLDEANTSYDELTSEEAKAIDENLGQKWIDLLGG